jgi:L-threonylcarbamoyladenylate synthase
VAGSVGQVERTCGPLDERSARLARIFWPGPLSLIVIAPAAFADAVHAGLGTIAIRVPNHAVARALADRWGAPLTATSANRSGDRPATRVEDLGDLADDARVLVLDAGPAAGGPPSTIVDARRSPPTLVRAGAIAWSRVLESLDA